MDIPKIDLKRLVRLERVSRLCDDLSRLLSLDIQIFNNRGEIFYQSPIKRPKCDGVLGDPASAARCAVSFEEACKTALAEGAARKIGCPGDFTTFLVPIGARPTIFGALVACQVVTEKTPYRRGISGEAPGGVDPGEVRDVEILGCLENIARFVADDCYQRIEIQNLTQELSNRYEELSLIYEIGRNIRADQSLEQTVDFLIEQVRYVLDPSACLVRAGESAFFRAFPRAEGRIGESDRASMEALAEGVRARIDERGEPVAINNLASRPEGGGAPAYGAMLAVPIKTESATHCVLHIFRPHGEDFMSGDVKLMEALAQQAAIMIENADLYRDLEALFLSTLKMLVKMIEARDEYTRGHSERVLAYAKALGAACGLTAAELKDLGWSALLHDFGKIRVPDAIIKKPARLDPEEWAVMKRHPKDGADLLRPIEQLRGAIAGVELHHERWDGRGYPYGLKAEQIPLQARIVSIVDAYDALTSNRAYRSPTSHRDAVEELARNAGTQFDPEIVALIERVFPESFDLPEGAAPPADLPKAA